MVICSAPPQLHRLHQPAESRLPIRLLSQVVDVLRALGQVQYRAVLHGFPPPGSSRFSCLVVLLETARPAMWIT